MSKKPEFIKHETPTHTCTHAKDKGKMIAKLWTHKILVYHRGQATEAFSVPGSSLGE